MPDVDETHDPTLTSWVTSANGHSDFPIQNLPLGLFSPPDGEPRGGIAIGDSILDLRMLDDANILSDALQTACKACAATALNPFLALGAASRKALRAGASALLARDSPARPDLLRRAEDCTMHLPAHVGDYTDFYAGIHHATNVGKLFRPDNPLLPNYKFVPIGYHGRASSLRPSGTPCRRPSGQRKRATESTPSFGPCERLDFELELGIWIGSGNELGTSVEIADAPAHIAGYCLLNDWSARDMQAWEYQPLGPFLAKSFATTLSPWIVTPEGLAPFRTAQPPRPVGDPPPLPYLLDAADQRSGALNVHLEIHLITPGMRALGLPSQRLSATSALNLYWTPAQLLTHHASNGCNLQPGDLFGTGTISSPSPGGFGSLLEMTAGGQAPIELASGETRHFLHDGDEVIFRGHAHAPGAVSIGFGECRGAIIEAQRKT